MRYRGRRFWWRGVVVQRQGPRADASRAEDKECPEVRGIAGMIKAQ